MSMIAHGPAYLATSGASKLSCRPANSANHPSHLPLCRCSGGGGAGGGAKHRTACQHSPATCPVPCRCAPPLPTRRGAHLR
eukprot:366442-Chlamydomonas_euryale.AAC.12